MSATRQAPLLLVLATAILTCAGCKRESTTVLERVDVDAQALLKESALGWGAAELNNRVAASLRGHGLPVLKEGEPVPSGAHALRGRLNLESRFDDASDSTPDEVAVAAVLQLKGKSLGALNTVSAQRQVPLTGAGPEARRDATVRAVEAVLEELGASAAALIKASGQSDEELIKALASPEAPTRKYAVKVLADRKNPAAVPALLEQLKDEDLDEVRAAIGELVELRDPRAVSAMIDTSHARDNVFQRDVVFALGAIGGEEAEAYLFTMAQGHDEPAIRAAAQQALDELKARQAKEGSHK